MKYTFSGIDGLESTHDNSSFVKNFLDMHSYDYWQKGTGSCDIVVKDSERLIFWQMKEGYFVIQNPDYLCPLITKGNPKINTLIHHIGGEPFKLPDACICTKDQLLDILTTYISSGELSPKFEWIEMYSLDFDSGY
jgi:hypothetical protein